MLRFAPRAISAIVIVAMALTVLPIHMPHVSAATDTEEFLSIEMIEGSEPLSGVPADAGWTGTDNGIATFSDGKIYAHSQGSAILRVSQTDGGTKTVYVSSYFEYPQPKTSIVQSSGDGVRLCKWAGTNEDHQTSVSLDEGDRITVLWRAMTSEGGDSEIMQYVRTPEGQEGYIRSNLSSDRPFAGNMTGYYTDMTVDDTIYKYPTVNGAEPMDTATGWTARNTNVLSVSKVDTSSGDNQGRIIALREGISSITADIDYGGKNMKTTAGITVYTPLGNLNGKINRDRVIVRRGAYSGYNPQRILNKDANVTINGECGNFYRIGQNQYVLKNRINIPITRIQLNESTLKLSAGKTETLKATLTPNAATDKNIIWSSSNTKVATVSQDGRVKAVGSGSATISAHNENSGLTAKCTVTVPAAAQKSYAPPSEGLKLWKVRTGYKSNKIGYTHFTGAVRYVTEKRRSGGSYRKVSTVNVTNVKSKRYYTDRQLKFKRLYYYRVTAYDINGIKLKSKAIRIRVGTPINAKASATSYSKVKVSWNKVPGVSGYKVYRKVKGKYKQVAKLKSGKRSWTNKGLKGSTRYHFRVATYKGKKNSRRTAAVSARTPKKKSAADKMTGYPGLQKPGNPDKKTITVRGKTYYPAIKYIMNGNVLQIHIYAKFRYDKSSKALRAYKSDFINGVKSIYSISINGDRRDFGNGVDFKTKVYFHEPAKGHSSEQLYVAIYLGGECPYCNSHWYHAYGRTIFDDNPVAGYQCYSSNFLVYMPTDKQVIAAGRSPEEDKRHVSAHEMGHIFGLADAYDPDGDGNLYSHNMRIIRNDETTKAVNKGKIHTNIMEDSELIDNVQPNDIEMMLNAYGDSIRYSGQKAWQAYRNHTLNEARCILSPKIKNKNAKHKQ